MKNKKEETLSPFKNEDEFDYILNVKMPLKIETDDEPDEGYTQDDDEIDAWGDTEADINNWNVDEDWLKILFPSVSLGYVYPELNEICSDYIDVRIGFKKGSSSGKELNPKHKPGNKDEDIYLSREESDKKYELNLKTIIEEAKDYIEAIIDDLTGPSFKTYTTVGYYDEPDGLGDYTREPEYEEGDPIVYNIKKGGEPVVEVIKEPKLNEDYDKKLVQEGNLKFERNNKLIEYKMTEDGVVEKYEDNKLVLENQFSKLFILRECKKLVQEGYLLKEWEPSQEDEGLDIPFIADMQYHRILKKYNDEDINKEMLIKNISDIYNKEDKEDIAEYILKNKLNKKEEMISRRDLERIIDEAHNDKKEEDLNSEDKSINPLKNIDIDKTKEDLQKGIEDVETIKDLHNQITNSLDELIESFPSNEFTQKDLSINLLESIDLNLKDNQKTWIAENIRPLIEFKNDLTEVIKLVSEDNDESVISIDNYIKEVLKRRNI